jgi:hypothetical protein
LLQILVGNRHAREFKTLSRSIERKKVGSAFVGSLASISSFSSDVNPERCLRSSHPLLRSRSLSSVRLGSLESWSSPSPRVSVPFR